MSRPESPYVHLLHSTTLGVAVTACGQRLQAPGTTVLTQDPAQCTCPACAIWEQAARQHAEEA